MRYLVSKCCNCCKVFGKKPLPPDYPKMGVKSLDNGDLTSHGICTRCIAELYPRQKDKK